MSRPLLRRTAPALVVACGAVAHAQRRIETPPSPARTERAPILTRVNPQDWTLSVRLYVWEQESKPGAHGFNPGLTYQTPPYDLLDAGVYFPLIVSSAAHDAQSAKTASSLEWRFYPRDKIVENGPRSFRVHDDAHEVVRAWTDDDVYGLWKLGEAYGREMQLNIDLPMRCWETEYHERAARDIPWPTRDLPEPLRAWLQPELFVESGDPAIVRLAAEMRKGPRNAPAPPALVAKRILGRVIESYQPNAGGVLHTHGSMMRTSDHKTSPDLRYITGFDLTGALDALNKGRGSPWNMPCLFVALCRAAGIPARLVIGYDLNESLRTNEAVYRVWAEFHLFDERDGAGSWVPVDPVRQREFGSRPPPLDQQWEFFGSIETLDDLIPMAFHFRPPVGDTNWVWAPMLWDWKFEPVSRKGKWKDILEYTYQELHVTAFNTPKRGDDAPDAPERAP